jgi:glycosyltransferase involved in cell wall biosynthesis
VRITIVQGAFLPVPPLMGGAVEKVWFNLGKEFARRGHTVVHLSRAHPELPARETIEGVKHLRVSGFASPATFASRTLLDLWYGLRVMPKLPAADILVTNTFWLPALERRATRGRAYVHVARYPKGQMKLYRRAILQTVSEPIREAILAEDPSAADRVRVIPYPLAPRYLSPTLAEGEDVILYTGRVHPEKGVHLLIEAFARLPVALRSKWKLKIVGPWEVQFGGGGEGYRSQLATAAAPVAERVEFVGRVFDETKLVGHYRSAKVFVYPSLAEKGETFGLAALEAMAAGAMPIVSSLGCFQDFIRNEDNGLIFDHRTKDPAGELQLTLGRVLPDSDRIGRLRDAAWKTARNYTMDTVVDMFLNDFTSLLPSGSRREPSAVSA